MRQTPKLDGILDQNHRILRHQDRICHSLQQLRVQNLLVRRTKRHKIVLGVRGDSHRLGLTQGPKRIRTHHPRRRLALVRNGGTHPPLVPLIRETTPLDVPFGRAATVRAHVDEGAMPRAAAETFQPHRPRSAKDVQMTGAAPRSSDIIVEPKAGKGRVHRLAYLPHHGAEVHVGRFQFASPYGSPQDAQVGRVVVSLGIARLALGAELGPVGPSPFRG
mmetsp:Transcript_26563/g.45341  ORF Transcript_26563/g.45341 Transcript_26563/m.45341 type:complete len:219 (+) Transcript_26563:391-1047(+)